MTEPKTKKPDYDATAARRRLERALYPTMKAEEEHVDSAKALFAHLVRILKDVGLRSVPREEHNYEAFRIAEHPDVFLKRQAEKIFITHEKGPAQDEKPVRLIWNTEARLFEGEELDRNVVTEPGKRPPQVPALDVLAKAVLERCGIADPS